MAAMVGSNSLCLSSGGPIKYLFLIFIENGPNKYTSLEIYKARPSY